MRKNHPLGNYIAEKTVEFVTESLADCVECDLPSVAMAITKEFENYMCKGTAKNVACSPTRISRNAHKELIEKSLKAIGEPTTK